MGIIDDIVDILEYELPFVNVTIFRIFKKGGFKKCFLGFYDFFNSERGAGGRAIMEFFYDLNTEVMVFLWVFFATKSSISRSSSICCSLSRSFS